MAEGRGGGSSKHLGQMLVADEARSRTSGIREDSEFTAFSRSKLWSSQRDYFRRVGIEAWRTNEVPSYPTTNPFISATYVRLIRAVAADLQMRPCVSSGEGGPIHIVELGAGSGRLAHNILAQLSDEEAPARFRYVMTDISEANIAAWRGHPNFRRCIDHGMLDFARFDAGRDDALHLEISGKTMDTGSSPAPMVVIGNYFVDGIEHDLFTLGDEGLAEVRVRLATETVQGEQPLTLDWQARPCASDFYGEPRYDAILRNYARTLDAGGHILFPIAAMRCFDALRAIAGGEAVFLLADKGQTRMPEAARAGPPVLAWHGSFSLDVNFHALGEWAIGAGGLALAPEHAHATIAVVACAFAQRRDWTALRTAYREAVEAFGPDDFYQLKKAAEASFDGLTVAQILAQLRLGRWDPVTFSGCYPRLLATLPEADEAQRITLRKGLVTLWAQYLPWGEDEDVAFQAACLLAGMGFYGDAIPLFEASLHWHGEDEATRANLERCMSMGGGE